MPWQQFVLDDALTLDEFNNFVRSTCGVLVARQNGKTMLMRMRILAGLYIFGEASIIAMAQNRQLALETFKQVVDLAESLSWMRKRIKRVSRTNGQEQLEVYCHHYPNDCNTKCARIRKYGIRAATSEGPRGATANLLYVDELREIKQEAWTAATPLTRATSGQTWITSNAGDGNSTVLNELRARALLMESPRIGWFEWSAEPNAELHDVEAWQAANPAMGRTITYEALRDAAARDTPDAIRTEMLCQWTFSIDSPFNLQNWTLGIDYNLEMVPGAPTFMGLDLNFNRTEAFLVTVQQFGDKFGVFLTRWQKDGGLIDTELASEIAHLARQYNTQIVGFDPKTAGHIAPYLARTGIAVNAVPWASTAFSTYCDVTLSALNANRLMHPNQETMHKHLIACARRPSSDGGWRIARKAAVQDISAAVAMVIALGHAAQPKATVGVSVV
jgi:phage terminase large subunit-like protein